ncbi:uncharacterized protein LOC132741775 isoform X2 [Ruditapes philippinarum]|uniref:uncharacterized protein LOC132741775 isoform X2 n=1 Tax=Ruditapes philippinarum TaxID=129788 RepID=UPI00295B760F|nr:uncharacterized protein LOC132741775 isoform X2 [Ruditapes philippinarum]
MKACSYYVKLTAIQLRLHKFYLKTKLKMNHQILIMSRSHSVVYHALIAATIRVKEATRLHSHSRTNIQLLVNCAPRPLFRIDQNISSILHVQAMLSFTTLAYPYPGLKGFSWQKENDANWAQVLTNRDFLITSTALQSNLTILNITKTDFGRYRLIVNNSIGTFIQHFNLAETILDEGEGFWDTYKSTIITGVSLGIVIAILVGVLVTILYRRKINRKGSQAHKNKRQKENATVAKKYDKQDQQGNAAYNERNPRMTQRQQDTCTHSVAYGSAEASEYKKK